MAVIPGLPPHLTNVPPAPDGPDDPLRDEKRAAYAAWRLALMRWRIQRQHEVRGDPELQAIEQKLCAFHPAYFASVWLNVREPRSRASGSGTIPFIPFAAQVEILDTFLWVLGQDDENADAVWSKCRGWGATWLGAMLGLWGWSLSHLFPQPMPWSVLYLSRNEEYVISKKQRSIFSKIRSLMGDLPPFLLPAGFDPKLHNLQGLIINPVNGNELGGESTNANAGRGDRVTWAWIDEAAAIPDLMNTWSTLAETTDHRWAVSTESVESGDDFLRLRSGRDMEDRPALMEADWWENPLLDDLWLDRQRKRYAADLDAFQREILRNPLSNTTTFVYPQAWEKAIDEGVEPIVGAPSFITVDPGFDDQTVLIAAQETIDGINVLDAYTNSRKPADFYAPLLKPSLLDEQDPDWQVHSEVVWIESGPEPQVFTYGPQELEFARTVVRMGGKPSYVGDTYGDNQTGATMDSVYSRWARHGIFVNRDRRGEKDLTAYTKQARTFKGRREALQERLGRWRFAATPGADRCLKAVQNNRFKPTDGKALVAAPKTPLHDWTSHYVSALEFLAVHLKQRGAINSREYAKPKRAHLAPLNGIAWRSKNLGKAATA